MTTVNGVSLAGFLATCPPDPGFTWARCQGCAAPLQSGGLACTGADQHLRPKPTTAYYATWTGTYANLSAMHPGGIRVITGPDQLDRLGLPPLQWALDNGAWGAFNNGRAFDAARFDQARLRWGDGADWIALPDIVAGGLPSLALSLSWLERVREHGRPMLIPVQDGMTVEDLRPHLGPEVGIFVGGSTEWKWATLGQWGALARAVGCYLHVGRVNSQRAIRKCADVGADSCDGTSATIYSVNAPMLAAAAREPARLLLPLWGG